jgi:hypothetical protein
MRNEWDSLSLRLRSASICAAWVAILRQRGHVDPRRLQLRIHLILLRQPRPTNQGVVCDEVVLLGV